VRPSAATAQGRGPNYGSKNMDPETSGTNARGDSDADARPATRLNPLLVARKDEPPDAPEETARPPADERVNAPPAADSPPPVATRPQPDPQPPPSIPNSTPDPNAPALSQAGQTQSSQLQLKPARSEAAPAVGKPASASSPPPAEKGAGPQTVSLGVLNGRAKSLPVPRYPETAMRARAEGLVVVEVLVDEGGKVISARAGAGPQLLREAAVSAARQARFAPAVVGGAPARVAGVINYTFRL
jgi:protein TonB